jgi:hypothetical protein
MQSAETVLGVIRERGTDNEMRCHHCPKAITSALSATREKHQRPRACLTEATAIGQARPSQ